ncbi:MAG: zinc finger domain-containing protein [Candidatus Hodarchaeales archaeon]|jgi:RecJ-like exonuclease
MTSKKCPHCKGSGSISSKTKKKCPKCRGMGSTKIVIGGGRPQAKDACSECKGSGKIEIIKNKTCPSCSGVGILQLKCVVCGTLLNKNDTDVCTKCLGNTSLHQLIPPVTKQAVEFKRLFLSKVVNVVDFGYFVQLAPKIEGLVRNKQFSGKRDDVVIVKLINKKGEKFEFEEVKIKDISKFPISRVHDPIPHQKIHQKREIGAFLSFIARIENIRQIPKGPKVFSLLDETGNIEAAAFGLDFVDTMSIGDIVEVAGQFNVHRGAEQIEISNMFVVEEAYSNAFTKKLDTHLDSISEPPDIEFLVKSNVLNLLKPKFIAVAKRLRRAFFESQPIIIRHHNDCDGICAGIAVELSLRQLWLDTYQQLDEDKLRHLIKRTVNKPPFYDPLDAVRDVNFALEDKNRFGDKLPLVLMLDTGSSEESLFSYKLLQTYNMEVMVVDHHFPSASVQDVVSNHLNNYYAGGDYNICTGMLGVELARFVNQAVTEDIIHIPAISGIGDRVKGEEFDQYLEFAKQRNYTESFLSDIAIAVDYQAYFLKFSPGRLLLTDLLGIKGTDERQLAFVKLLATEARDLLEKQLQISLEFCQETDLPNGIHLAILDVEKFTSRFDYPPPGKITGSLFDHLGGITPNIPLVTIGLGPDFAIFRSQHVKLDFPNLVRALAEDMPHANIEGGGHEIVGSLKFITGARSEFMEIIQEKLTIISVSISKSK